VSGGGVARPAVTALAEAVRAGERRALARAITLVESRRPDHRAEAEALEAALLPHSGRSVRIGISGVPGVGKSTFIEAFGMHLIGLGHRVAVLAVDPSSKLSGGSILGDKTRMEELGRSPEAFTRPSPTGESLGGVARRTREAMLICEAAGFDVVIVETVGVGQSETAVADLADLFLLLLPPGGGDELQGLKKGIVELADILVVNKADGELEAAAGRAAAEYRSALHLLQSGETGWRPPVLTCSAETSKGIAEVWAEVERYGETLGSGISGAGGTIAEKRARQARGWMWSEVSESLLARLRRHPAVAESLAELEGRVMAGSLTPAAAARRLLATFLGDGEER
jgi:LAO/AO transport system kinase